MCVCVCVRAVIKVIYKALCVSENVVWRHMSLIFVFRRFKQGGGGIFHGKYHNP